MRAQKLDAVWLTDFGYGMLQGARRGPLAVRLVIMLGQRARDQSSTLMLAAGGKCKSGGQYCRRRQVAVRTATIVKHS
jgi:hypothetical protein